MLDNRRVKEGLGAGGEEWGAVGQGKAKTTHFQSSRG